MVIISRHSLADIANLRAISAVVLRKQVLDAATLRSSDNSRLCRF